MTIPPISPPTQQKLRKILFIFTYALSEDNIAYCLSLCFDDV